MKKFKVLNYFHLTESEHRIASKHGVQKIMWESFPCCCLYCCCYNATEECDSQDYDYENW